jgi:hypothetical protein
LNIDRSISKTADDALKATALLGIFAVIQNRVILYYQCAEDFNLFAYLAAFFTAIFFLWLGISVMVQRILYLYPWIFFGRNWLGIVIYVALLFLTPVLSVQLGKVLIESWSAIENPGEICTSGV